MASCGGFALTTDGSKKSAATTAEKASRAPRSLRRHDARSRRAPKIREVDTRGLTPRGPLRKLTILNRSCGNPFMRVSRLRAARLACSSVVILNEGLQDEVTAQEPILGSLRAPVLASFDLTK